MKWLDHLPAMYAAGIRPERDCPEVWPSNRLAMAIFNTLRPYSEGITFGDVLSAIDLFGVVGWTRYELVQKITFMLGKWLKRKNNGG